MMDLSRIFFVITILAAPLACQSSDPGLQRPGARLVLLRSEPLTEPRFPKTKVDPERRAGSAEATRTEQAVRPAILELKPAGDPIYLVDELVPDDDQEKWRTYRRPKVEQFSRDGEGIAVQGYDVVSYLEERAEKGTKEFSVDYGGTIWLFATAEHRDLFARDPERYVPAYGGFCSYSVAKGYPATADPRVFTIEGGKLYLFFDKAVKTAWEQDHSRLIRMADHYWPTLHR